LSVLWFRTVSQPKFDNFSIHPAETQALSTSLHAFLALPLCISQIAELCTDLPIKALCLWSNEVE
jgi:hypothetical protein